MLLRLRVMCSEIAGNGGTHTSGRFTILQIQRFPRLPDIPYSPPIFIGFGVESKYLQSSSCILHNIAKFTLSFISTSMVKLSSNIQVFSTTHLCIGISHSNYYFATCYVTRCLFHLFIKYISFVITMITCPRV